MWVSFSLGEYLVCVSKNPSLVNASVNSFKSDSETGFSDVIAPLASVEW